VAACIFPTISSKVSSHAFVFGRPGIQHIDENLKTVLTCEELLRLDERNKREFIAKNSANIIETRIDQQLPSIDWYGVWPRDSCTLLWKANRVLCAGLSKIFVLVDSMKYLRK
jgi:hypothetical protein